MKKTKTVKSKRPHFTVAICVIMSWKNEIFSKMGVYAKESQYFYHHFTQYCRDNNVSLIRADFRWYDKKRGLFTKAWIYDPLMGWIRANDVKADIVHDLAANKPYLLPIKRYFERKGMLAANPYQLDKILTDKLLNYKTFKKFYPQTIEVKDKKQLLKAINKIPGEKIVLKPREGSSAKNVNIVSKAKAAKFEIVSNTLVQQLIESDPVADYRIVFCNGKFLHAYTRIAAKGSYFVNFSKGGSMKMLKRSELPYSVKKKWKEIEKYFKQYAYSMLTVDFQLDQKEEAWIIEMNAKPGKVLYRPNGAPEAFDQIMKASLKNYQIVFDLKNGARS